MMSELCKGREEKRNKRRIFISHGRLVDTEWRTPPRRRGDTAARNGVRLYLLSEWDPFAEKQLGKDEGRHLFSLLKTTVLRGPRRLDFRGLNICRFTVPVLNQNTSAHTCRCDADVILFLSPSQETSRRL